MSDNEVSNQADELSGKGDFFADIAGQELTYRDGSLVEPHPLNLPEVNLPFQVGSESGGFHPVARAESADGLAAELELLRVRYAPFMSKLSPELESVRDRIGLDAFSWRMETEADRADFDAACKGAGDWEVVSIPHYDGPLGKACSLYRTGFTVTQEQLDIGAAMIHFSGVDYKAHVFVNGYFVGSHEGFFAPFEFDISDLLKLGSNQIVVRVENDAVFNGNRAWGQNYSGDKIYAATGPGYDDPEFGWHHCPPGMGIYQKVFVEFRPEVHLGDLYVRPLLDEDRVEVWMEVVNTTFDDAEVSVLTSIYGRNFEATVVKDFEYKPEVVHDCGLGDTFQIAKAKAEGKYLKAIPLLMERGVNFLRVSISMEDYRLWSLETPWLYQCRVELRDEDGRILDRLEQHFGMRSFVMDEEAEMKGGLFLNGAPIRLRGANTMGHEQQCVMKGDWDQLRDDILLAKLCNMNFLRFTQRPVQDEIYDYCDMLGLMTQTDLPLFGVIRRNQYCEVLSQVEEMEKLVRSHPCNIMVTYINEPTRNADNRPHRHIQRDEMERLFAAADDIVHHLNPERVIKACDGDYDPPSPGIQDRHCYPCWYNGHGMDIGMLHRGFWQPTKPGWYYGCGEFGAEGLDFSDLMRERYPKNWLQGADDAGSGWSPSEILWAQTGNYHYFFFDTQDVLDDWVEASQAHQAFGTKIMTEAFRRDSCMVTFAIHLFIDAFPAGWMKTIMDCKRRPKPAFFAYRDALAPMLPSIRTDRSRFTSGEAIRLELWVCNDLSEFDSDLSLRYVFESSGIVLGSGTAAATTHACHSDFQGYLSLEAPQVEERTEYQVRLAIVDSMGKVLNDCVQALEVFPEMSSSTKPVTLINESGRAEQLAAALGCSVNTDLSETGEGSTILIDAYADYMQYREMIDQAAERGARVVLLNLEQGQYDVAGDVIDVKLSDFNPLYFASCKTGSRYVDGFKKDDVSYWYDPSLDRISHLLEATFLAPGYAPILSSGNTKNGKWAPALAVAEKNHGAGVFVICQVDLAGRVTTNPTAEIFARRVLALQGDEPAVAGVQVMEGHY